MTKQTAIIEIAKPTHGTLPWQLIRPRYNDKCVVGSSEVSIIMGANDYETVTDLAVRKLLPPVVTEANDAMTRGNVLEPALIQHAQNELMMPLITPDVMYLNGRIVATLDARGMGGERHVVVEAKTNNRWALGMEIPTSWWWQAQAQMHCTETDKVTFVVLDKHMRLGLQDVVRSDEGITQMVKSVELFCEAIDAEKLPDETQLTAPQVSALFAQPEGTVELDASAYQLIEEWSAVKDALKHYEDAERTLKDKLANMLRGAEFGTISNQKVLSYKAQSTKRLDTKALAEAHPEIATAYTTASTFRVLRIMK
jgi:predicted phage-related endonuclease